jgi:hypothetical protein
MTLANLIDELGKRLQWAGFRALTQAELASGPTQRRAGGLHHVRLAPGVYNAAIIAPLGSQADVAQFLDHEAAKGWGYDLNLERHANRTETINEIRFAISEQLDPISAELGRCGHSMSGRSLWRADADCLVPALGEDYGGEIHPCFGWVLLPGATSEFAPAEQRFGFSTRDVPEGALTSLEGRGYRFVHGGYPHRAVLRRRIVVPLDPRTATDELSAALSDALSIAYGAP